MTKPKYQIGDKVWGICISKAVEVIIYAVVATKEGFAYQLRQEESIKFVSVDNWIREEELFPSKEELIKSL